MTIVKQESVKLNIAEIKALIEYWRIKKNEAMYNGGGQQQRIAECYIDAFQTILINHGLQPDENQRNKGLIDS